MSNQNLIDVDNQVEEEVESEKMDDDQTIENPEVREVSTHEVDELNESEEINDDDLEFDMEIARLSSKTSESEEEKGRLSLS